MSLPSSFSRRNFLALAGLGAVSTLASCASTIDNGPVVSPVQYTGSPRPFRTWFSSYDGEQPDPAVIYASVEDGGFVVPAVPYKQIDPRFYRQRVIDPTGEAPGSVVVNTTQRMLYVTEQGGTAMRYGIGVGREGFAWQGRGVIQWRKKWPRWNPPDEMVARQLYIFEDKQDSLYRLHGNPEWRSIGKAVSSGCVRLLNQDVIDLYDRVPERAPILVTA